MRAAFRRYVYAQDVMLGTRHELGMSWIMPMRPLLERTIPNLTLHLYVGSGTELAQRVRARELDCAVTSSRILDPKPDMRAVRENQRRAVDLLPQIREAKITHAWAGPDVTSRRSRR